MPKIKNIPRSPGCYIYKNKAGKIIYVGKAKDLKKRVNSYSERAKIALMAIKMFKIRVCKKFPEQACLQYHIGNCLAPCVGLISREDYLKNIKDVELFLKGDIKNLTQDLKKQIKSASNIQNYESAKIFHEQLKSLEILEERQKVDLLKKVNQDVINFIIYKNSFFSQVFHIKRGTILNKKKFEFKNEGEEEKILTAFVKQYYATKDIPHEIILPAKLYQQNLIKKYLEKLANRKVELQIPPKGVKKELLEDDYRKFKIKFQKEQNDFAAMAEIVFRRYEDLKQKN